RLLPGPLRVGPKEHRDRHSHRDLPFDTAGHRGVSSREVEGQRNSIPHSPLNPFLQRTPPETFPDILRNWVWQAPGHETVQTRNAAVDDGIDTLTADPSRSVSDAGANSVEAGPRRVFSGREHLASGGSRD